VSSREVLCCGGPLVGTWRVEQAHEFHVPVTPRIVDWKNIDPEGILKTVIYRLVPCMILGHELWVAVAVDEAYDDRAVLRAILQRDVATYLGAY
jgi:hypothetical protein